MKNKSQILQELEIAYIPRFPLKEQPKISSSRSAYELLVQLYNPKTIYCQEEVIVLYLNNNHHIIGAQNLSKGGICSTIIDIRLILATALKSLSTAILLSHNHPSGNTLPSKKDREITAKLLDACKMLDIAFIDHIIVTADNGYYSFVDEDIM